MQPAFGAASTPAFGAASTPAFGSAATPAFGGGNAFGVSCSYSSSRVQVAVTSEDTTVTTRAHWVQAKPAAGFGGFGAASTPSLFGAASQVHCLPCAESWHHPEADRKCDKEEHHDHK